MDTVQILIGGDLSPQNGAEELFKKGDAHSILNDLFDDFQSADMAMVNLECPLIDRHSPIKKSGPSLGVNGSVIRGIQNSKINLLGLANNHIMDHGSSGLENTLRLANDYGLDTVGAGKNLKEAGKIYVKKIQELRIGVMALAEHEWSIATDSNYGANPLELMRVVRTLMENKKKLDYLIVLVHGGNEYYQLPSPRLADTCRFLIELGANAVICQHSHRVGAFENYNEGIIVYGQGNFIFDYPGMPDFWNQGLLIGLNIKTDQPPTIDFIPTVQSRETPGIKRMNQHDSKSLLEEFYQRSEKIKDDTYLVNQWRAFCKKNKKNYFGKAMGLSKPFRYLYNKGLFNNLFQDSKSIRTWHNMIRCESHREVLLTLMQERDKE